MEKIYLATNINTTHGMYEASTERGRWIGWWRFTRSLRMFVPVCSVLALSLYALECAQQTYIDKYMHIIVRVAL